ncbi:transcription elongation factor Elf1 like-domain-containing protein [Crucibulum laeve]|uniref:Transcription elongation factor 1 homolog n=1 Tax=Crucibulum laeve TaxID=68775 RepID=A0A5C3MCT4_9AGAR|nr:transcription elongation factor Elf1 like-domain-containing protein [Crucibulum laeve]
MGKRKKSSKKPAPSRQKVPLDTAFTCLFCHHDKSVTVRMDRKEGVAQLVCRVCDQRYQSKVNHLTEPIDIYSEWLDSVEQVNQRDDHVPRRPIASSSRSLPTAADSDDE